VLSKGGSGKKIIIKKEYFEVVGYFYGSRENKKKQTICRLGHRKSKRFCVFNFMIFWLVAGEDVRSLYYGMAIDNTQKTNSVTNIDSKFLSLTPSIFYTSNKLMEKLSNFKLKVTRTGAKTPPSASVEGKNCIHFARIILPGVSNEQQPATN
jgi:hypothetical protein